MAILQWLWPALWFEVLESLPEEVEGVSAMVIVCLLLDQVGVQAYYRVANEGY